MNVSLIAAAILALTTLHAAGQAPAKTAVELEAMGPQVGQRPPDFSLYDQNGRVHTLASALGGGGAMLVFFRSADW